MCLTSDEVYTNYVYSLLMFDTMDLDSIYKDFILRAVGTYGFNALYEHKLIESCGSINGRELYVLTGPRLRGEH